MSNRRNVREHVLQALYAFELSGDSVEHILETLIRPTLGSDREALRFAERLLIRTLENRDEVEAFLQAHLDNWDITRLALTDRIVLRMAVTELLTFEDIPPKVTLNEAVEVARAFGGDGSGGFVNGVLDSTLTDLRSSGKLKKRGRGLVETSTT